MKKHLCHLLAATAFFFAWQNVAAQNDSLLDLGRIKIRKDFAQTITIKGSDLQKIPFGTISEVIAPWLQGGMNSKGNLVFVVDGNLVNDVNAWSIYDIEEIVLVQNALVQANGAINQQQLVLVKTKRNTAETGITIAGSSALAKTDSQDPIHNKSETNFYHQYHVAARKNLGKISVGASVNWLRDVNPLVKIYGLKTETVPQLKRFRVNGWFNVALAKGHSISAGLNYVPQTVAHEYTYGTSSLSTHYIKQKQSLLNPHIKLSNRIAEGLTNEISFSYLSVRSPSETGYRDEYIQPTPPNTIFNSRGEELSKTRNLLLREQISYRKKIGDWLLEPAVNFTFRSIKQTGSLHYEASVNNNPPSISIATWRYEANSYVLTPSAGISYKNSFHLLGGVAASLTDDTKPYGDGIFPFASAMLDLLRIGNADNPQSLKIFGSYSQAPNFFDMYYSQQDGTYNPSPSFGPDMGPIFGPGILVPAPYPEDPKRNSIQLGAAFATAANRLELSYNFDDRSYVDQLLYSLPTPQGNVLAIAWPDYSFTSHRLGILAKLVENPGFGWRSGLNVTTFKSKLTSDQVFPQEIVTVSNNDKNNWTGGFTNRFQAGRFSFGLDILYLLNEQRPIYWTSSATTFDKVNSWRLNNVYVSYSPSILKSHVLELYLTARNSVQSDKAGFWGRNVQYFGAGFKLQF